MVAGLTQKTGFLTLRHQLDVQRINSEIYLALDLLPAYKRFIQDQLLVAERWRLK